MARARKDIEFVVNDKVRYKTFDAAAGFAVRLGASHGDWVSINVLIYSVAAARAWGGDDAVEEYKADPDASVSDRIRIKVDHIGRVA